MNYSSVFKPSFIDDISVCMNEIASGVIKAAFQTFGTTPTSSCKALVP